MGLKYKLENISVVVSAEDTILALAMGLDASYDVNILASIVYRRRSVLCNPGIEWISIIF
jgi:hypothetical protein